MEQKTMNMISTGAFLSEVDASNKQDTLVSKLVTAWEKKNSKTARAGGVSLMALSLAACGSSEDDSAVSYTQVQLDAAKAAATTAAEAVAATAATAATAAAATATAAAAATAATAQAAAVAAVDLTTDNAAAILAAVQAVDATASTVAEVKSNAAGPTDLTIKLTASTAGDDLEGSSGADTFVAGTTARLQDADVIDGGAGIDTLTAKLNSATAHDAGINDVEILNFDVLGASTILASQITGATNINLTGGAVLTLTNASAGIAYNISEANTGLTLTQAGTNGTSDTVTVTMGTGALGTITLGTSAGVEFETVNLVAAGATSATITEGGTAAFDETGESIVVTGSGDLLLNIAGAAIGADTATSGYVASTVDASGHTGALTIDIGQLGANEFFNASKLTGVDTLRLSTGTGDDDTINNILAGTSIYLDGIENATNELTLDPNGTGTSDVLNLTLAHATAGTSIDLNAVIFNGFETVNLTSSGTNTTTTVANVLDDVAGLSTDTTLNISGDKKLTATGIENTWTTITSTNTTATDLTVDSGGALQFTGGSGADRLEIDTVADLTAADLLAGGTGRDTLAISAVPSAVTNAQLGYVSGFEKIEFEATNIVAASFTLDLDQETEMDTLIFTGELTTAATKVMTVNANSGFRVEMGGHTGPGSADDFNIVITNAANAGTNDTVTLALANIGADDAHAGLQIDNVENFVVEVSGDVSHTFTLADVDGAQLSNITIKSTNTTAATDSDHLTITTAESTIISTVDMSAMTGDTDITGLGTKLIGSGATITGGTGADSITGGAGADVISAGADNDILIGAGGNDAITGGEGTDTITGGLGSDTITLTEDTKAIDSIVGTTGGALAVDTVVGFDTNSAAELGDNYDIDLSDLNGIVTNMLTGDGTPLSAATAPTLTAITAAYDLGGANSDILVLSGDFATTSVVETALEAGGSRALTSDDANASYIASDAFLVLYDDGTDTYLSHVAFGTDPGDNSTFASADLTATNFMKFQGNSDATAFVSNNFDVIA
jgi:hypothetical protein